jgi:hypothetical protein
MHPMLLSSSSPSSSSPPTLDFCLVQIVAIVVVGVSCLLPRRELAGQASPPNSLPDGFISSNRACKKLPYHRHRTTHICRQPPRSSSSLPLATVLTCIQIACHLNAHTDSFYMNRLPASSHDQVHQGSATPHTCFPYLTVATHHCSFHLESRYLGMRTHMDSQRTFLIHSPHHLHFAVRQWRSHSLLFS